MKKFVALFLAILTLTAVCIPSAMALTGGYEAATKYLSTSTLKVGYGTKQAVSNLQYMLKDLGYNPGTADGIYGSRTKQAVTAFQLDYDLTPDGQCGRNTKTKIWESLNKLPDDCY